MTSRVGEIDQSWHIYKDCDYCRRSICVNNYADRKTRTPKFLGLVCCPWCDPRASEDRWLWRDSPTGERPRITNPTEFRTLVSVWIVRQLAINPRVGVMKQIRKLWDEEGKPYD